VCVPPLHHQKQQQQQQEEEIVFLLTLSERSKLNYQNLNTAVFTLSKT